MYYSLQDADKYLGLNLKIEINFLDYVVDCEHDGNDEVQQRAAQKVLATFRERLNSWAGVKSVLVRSKKTRTKCFALGILDNFVRTRWKILSEDENSGIKAYVSRCIGETCSDSAVALEEEGFLNALNAILIQILRREWPNNWSDFINEIVSANRTNESLCQNNMIILKLLNQEIFDSLLGQITRAKSMKLKNKLRIETTEIFRLIQLVISNFQNTSLALRTLETLFSYLHLIPPKLIFESTLISSLIHTFLNEALYRNITLKCLTKISDMFTPLYESKFIVLFKDTLVQLKRMLPTTITIKTAYGTSEDNYKEFIRNLSIHLSSFLKTHARRVENQQRLECTHVQYLNYLLLISEVKEVCIFKNCLQYWKILTSELYKEQIDPSSPIVSTRHLFYQSTLTKVRNIIINRMVAPENEFSIENEHGEAVPKDVEAVQIYKDMKETLIHLIHLNTCETLQIMTNKLHRQVGGLEWSRTNLNSVCWAIGSIGGVITELNEKAFTCEVIRLLLKLCEERKDTEDKIFVMSNLMHVIVQCPTILKTSHFFLLAVLHKLYEFMHSNLDGVQVIACETFAKMARTCGEYFVYAYEEMAMPLVQEIVNDAVTTISDLEPQQIYSFYEAVGCIICKMPDDDTKMLMVKQYMLLPNKAWDNIILQSVSNIDFLKSQLVLKHIIMIIRTDIRACKELGHSYVEQFRYIYLSLLGVYKVMSEGISANEEIDDGIDAEQAFVSSMRIVRKDVLNLISCWTSQSTDPQMFLCNFISPFVEIVLVDYHDSITPTAKEANVLSTMTTIINRLGGYISIEITRIFDLLFECTLNMINSDYDAFPEHRINVFLFLKATITHSFSVFLNIPLVMFKNILDIIVWTIKHPQENISEIGYEILHRFMENVWKEEEETGQKFYQMYYTYILERLLYIVIDTSGTIIQEKQAAIFSYMFGLVESLRVHFLLNQAQQENSGQSNVLYVKEYVTNLLKIKCCNLTDLKIQTAVQGFSDLCFDIPAFKEHLQDVLIEIRDFSEDSGF